MTKSRKPSAADIRAFLSRRGVLDKLISGLCLHHPAGTNLDVDAFLERNAANPIGAAFKWQETPEGREFWYAEAVAYEQQFGGSYFTNLLNKP